MPCQTSSCRTWLQPRSASHQAQRRSPIIPSVKFVAHALCPSVWPERTQMEAHSVLAAPHNCAEMLSSSTATDSAEPSTPSARSRDTTALQHFIMRLAIRKSPGIHISSDPQLKSDAVTMWRSSLLQRLFFCTTSLVCVCFNTSSSRRPASQVCVLQLVLWIRPMTDTSYNPAISQHQGGTAPLPTRRRTATWCCSGRWCKGCKKTMCVACTWVC